MTLDHILPSDDARSTLLVPFYQKEKIKKYKEQFFQDLESERLILKIKKRP